MSICCPTLDEEPRNLPAASPTSAITPKPATCDQLKTGHFESFGDVVPYFELESLGKLAA